MLDSSSAGDYVVRAFSPVATQYGGDFWRILRYLCDSSVVREKPAKLLAIFVTDGASSFS